MTCRNSSCRRVRIFAFALAVAFASLDVSMGGNDLTTLTFRASTPAEAVIGRPLTPLSYAGVARRTTRRVVRRTNVYISTLSAGCVYGAYYGATITAADRSTTPRAALPMCKW
ncbi:hypothetical protein LPU83_2811 [Rhizobium favelukesii]|uniref:Secreted protein n=1 Tax=Rhizobium favelukesii TaxID=348824 RepID=W6RB30_9HYPH|nr:hypothetical protein LPU83_2811 [Rhizobium favelukesii]